MKGFSIKILLLGIWRIIKMLPKEYLIKLVIDLLEYIASKTENKWDDVQVAKLSDAYVRFFKNKK